MMKRWLRRGIAVGLTVCLMCCCGIPAAADKANTYIGSLLEESFILDGAENITINEDRTWTVTGPFTLSCPLSFDYRTMEMGIEVRAVQADGYFDFDIPFTVSSTRTETLALAKDIRGELVGAGEGSWAVSFGNTYRGYQALCGWDTPNYQVHCETLTYRPITATEVTLSIVALSRYAAHEGLVYDVNKDSVISTADAREMLCGILQNKSRSYPDINDDYQLTTADVRLLLIEIVQAM